MVKRPTNKVKGASDCKFSSIYTAKQREKWRCEQIVLAVSIFARQRFMTIDVFPEFQAVRSCMLQTLRNGRYSFLSLQHFKTIIQFDTEKYTSKIKYFVIQKRFLNTTKKCNKLRIFERNLLYALKFR